MNDHATPDTEIEQRISESGKTMAEYYGLSSDTLKLLYSNAVGAYENNRNEEAVVFLFQLTALNPKFEDAWILMGNALMRVGRHSEALTAWEMAQACSPRFTSAAMIARTAIAIGALDRAAEALLMASRLKVTAEQNEELDALVEAWYQARS